jgi:Phospholipase_D-nuclease N-terminal
MLVLGALVAMVATGVWLYCLVDILVTSKAGCRYLPKMVWLAVVALTFAAGAAAWLLLGRPVTASAGATGAATAARARSRHPAGRAWAIGPDDDPEFLRELDHLIRGGYDTGNEL